MNDTVFIIVKIVVSVIFGLVGAFLIPLLKQSKKSNEDDEIFTMIEIAVRAAEQTIKGSGQGAVKKQEVLDYVTNWLNDRGFGIKEDQLNQLIEAAVYAMNNQ